jgi:transcriptional accessory protein Tex/SPT6
MPLDNTNVHPESYKAANMLLKLCGATLQELGQDKFISTVKTYVEKYGMYLHSIISFCCKHCEYLV